MTYAPPHVSVSQEAPAFSGCSLSPSPDVARRARSFTRQTLASWDLAELADDAQVIVSELLANAVGTPGSVSPTAPLVPGPPRWACGCSVTPAG